MWRDEAASAGAWVERRKSVRSREVMAWRITTVANIADLRSWSRAGYVLSNVSGVSCDVSCDGSIAERRLTRQFWWRREEKLRRRERVCGI